MQMLPFISIQPQIFYFFFTWKCLIGGFIVNRFHNFLIQSSQHYNIISTLGLGQLRESETTSDLGLQMILTWFIGANLFYSILLNHETPLLFIIRCAQVNLPSVTHGLPEQSICFRIETGELYYQRFSTP